MAVAAETRESKAIHTLAVEKMHHGRFREAMRDLEQALRLVPEQPLYVSTYGICLAQERQFEAAIEHCKRALSYAPDDTVLQVNLGKVYKLRGDKSAAHRIFLSAWQSNRRHAAPAVELTRMGIRRPPVLRFLPRAHRVNRWLGRLRRILVRDVRDLHRKARPILG